MSELDKKDGVVVVRRHGDPVRQHAPVFGYSVAFGWPVVASVSQTVRCWSSMQYQSRPAAVTSYCQPVTASLVA